MTVTQSTQNLIANWQSFDVGQNAVVTFIQPNAGSIALNRIVGQNPSQIFGALKANGQVMLINPAGIVFGPGSQIDVGGLVASTLDLSDQNFLAGHYRFTGNSTGAIDNQGQITAKGGVVALMAPLVSNEGVIASAQGSSALVAGNDVTLDFTGDGLLGIRVNLSTAAALARNGGLIQASGGTVILTAGAASDVLSGAVNNSGMIQATSMAARNGRILLEGSTVSNSGTLDASGQGGQIRLLGNMSRGTVMVGGTLDASAANGGNGGFIETSAATVKVSPDARVTTLAPQGKGGTWLIDPADFTIAASGGDMTGAQVGQLVTTGGNLTIQSSSGTINANGSGDINVNDPVNWSANTLTLNAQRNIKINANLTGTGSAKLALLYGQSAPNAGNAADYVLASGASIVLPPGPSFSTQLGNDVGLTPYTIITSLGALQGIADGTNYALGADIDAAATTGWNGGKGFLPIASYASTIAGLGHTVSNLYINDSTDNRVGLIGVLGGTIRDIGLLNESVNASGTSAPYIGGLAGLGDTGSSIVNSYVSGTINTNGTSHASVGGLVGWASPGTPIANSHSSTAVTVINDMNGPTVGGLVGYSAGATTNSYASGPVVVSGVSEAAVGGLVGLSQNATVTGSYANNTVTVVSAIGASVGGLVGYNLNGTVANSHSDGVINVSNTANAMVGGLVGTSVSSDTPGSSITSSYANEVVTVTNASGSPYIGGLVGYNNAAITNSYASTSVTASGTSGASIGGLVGFADANGTIINTYANGAVAGGPTDSVGGLAGMAATLSGTFAIASFYDTTTTGRLVSAGGVGMSTSDMKTLANFTQATPANGSTNPGWDLGATWVMYDGYTYPLLRSFMTPLTLTANGATKTYDGTTAVLPNSLTGVTYTINGLTSTSAPGNLFYANTTSQATGQYPLIAYSNQKGYIITMLGSPTITITPVPTPPLQPRSSPPLILPPLSSPLKLDSKPVLRNDYAPSMLTGTQCLADPLSSDTIAPATSGYLDIDGQESFVPFNISTSANETTVSIAANADWNPARQNATTKHAIFSRQKDGQSVPASLAIRQQRNMLVATTLPVLTPPPMPTVQAHDPTTIVKLILPGNLASQFRLGLGKEGQLLIQVPDEMANSYSDPQISLLALLVAQKRLGVKAEKTGTFILWK